MKDGNIDDNNREWKITETNIANDHGDADDANEDAFIDKNDGGGSGSENNKDNDDNIGNNSGNNDDENSSDGGRNADNYTDDSGLWDGN